MPRETKTTTPLRPPVDLATLNHTQLLEGAFWRRVPAYAKVRKSDFLDHRWQAKNTVTRVAGLWTALKGLVTETFIKDVEEGLQHAPMAIRVSPYIISLIDWSRPYEDPLRLQFLPVASQRLPEHPKLGLDSLQERAHMTVPGLAHRYHDKALFLPLDTCPVYCRFCTRSYAVGIDTAEVSKFQLRVNAERWQQAFKYIASRPELEDVVISGGDAYQLRPEQLRHIGETLLRIDHIRRIRYGTRGLAVMPQKVLSDDAWCDALTSVVDLGRKLHKEVAVHTHFNHPDEITVLTQAATARLMERGVTVRNQTVLQRNVNDNVVTMKTLVKRLSYVNVQPYYVYMHDLVRGVEDLRTTLECGLTLEKHVRGATAGFNTPVFVVDAPGGGGKRNAHSYEHYNRTTGVSVYISPSVELGRYYFYFDPIHLLPEDARARWADPAEQQKMLDEALEAAIHGNR